LSASPRALRSGAPSWWAPTASATGKTAPPLPPSDTRDVSKFIGPKSRKLSAGNANVSLGKFGRANVWRSKPRYVCPCVISGDARIRRKRFNGLSQWLGRQSFDPGGPPASRGFAKPRSHCGARCHQGERSVCDAADSLRGSHVGSAADDRWAGNQGSEVMI